MADEVRITVNIDENAVQALLKDEVVQDDMDRRAEAVLRRQQSIVPVDTRNLQKHLMIKPTDDGNGRLIGAFDEIVDGRDCDYGAAIELGYEHHKSGNFIPAQPYVRPSIDAARD